MTKQIYLDYNAATPIDSEVLQELIFCRENFANPASPHYSGQNAAVLLENSRESIADFLKAKPQEIIFTSSGTESNNTVLWQMLNNKKLKKLIISEIEHSSVSEYADFLKEKQIEVIKIRVDNQGFIDLDLLKENTDENSLVSIIWANNEIGTIQDVERISEIVKESGALLHFDAVQALGKIEISLKNIRADFLSLSSQKVYGPRGIGALFVREKVPFFPFIIGGGQENGMRSGTANQILAAGFAKATKLQENLVGKQKEIWALRETLIEKLKAEIPQISFNGAMDFNKTLAGTLSITIPDIENEIIVLRLDNAGIFVSKGSACSSNKVAPSNILTAIGLNKSMAAKTIRVSLGKETKNDEISTFSEKLTEIVQNIRKSRNSI
jgi:cysteine desulfurase